MIQPNQQTNMLYTTIDQISHMDTDTSIARLDTNPDAKSWFYITDKSLLETEKPQKGIAKVAKKLKGLIHTESKPLTSTQIASELYEGLKKIKAGILANPAILHEKDKNDMSFETKVKTAFYRLQAEMNSLEVPQDMKQEDFEKIQKDFEKECKYYLVNFDNKKKDTIVISKEALEIQSPDQFWSVLKDLFKNNPKITKVVIEGEPWPIPKKYLEDLAKDKTMQPTDLLKETQIKNPPIKEYQKIILINESPYFKKLFTGRFKEGNKSQSIELEDAKALKKMFKVLFTENGLNRINEKNVAKLLQMSDMYMLDDLKTACTKYLENSINEKNAVDYFILGAEYQADHLKTTCLKHITKWLDYVHEIRNDKILRGRSEVDVPKKYRSEQLFNLLMLLHNADPSANFFAKFRTIFNDNNLYIKFSKFPIKSLEINMEFLKLHDMYKDFKKNIDNLTSVESLTIDAGNYSVDKSNLDLSKMPNLKSLTINGGSINKLDLPPGITYLRLKHCTLSDKVREELSNLKNVKVDITEKPPPKEEPPGGYSSHDDIFGNYY